MNDENKLGKIQKGEKLFMATTLKQKNGDNSEQKQKKMKSITLKTEHEIFCLSINYQYFSLIKKSTFSYQKS